jgi:predicted nicotinamide N-methyase
VTGVYEGGLKIWECSFDLELGCGAGLPAIVAGLLGAVQTDFQVGNIKNIDPVLNKNPMTTLHVHCTFYYVTKNTLLSVL